MSAPASLIGYTAAVLGRLLRAGELDARELTEYFIERVVSCADPAVFITTCFERAPSKHSRAPNIIVPDVRLARSTVYQWRGRILSISPTCRLPPVYRHAPVASSDAPVVGYLAAAGMVTLGKTNLSEFAYSALGLNPHFGTPCNPDARDKLRVPGGSSSGSGVAVAAGLVPIAIGTDTGGSVRTPAAFNGVVGFKTSERRIDRSGVFPLSQVLDTIGVFAHD